MQKGTVPEKFWNADNGAVDNPRHWLLLEGYKRERSLNGVGKQSIELMST
ncbi:Uncharacterized protein APZ42_005384 [Daphnia magna]|uniref:Uncharacterized protein n=1 Tax=Daphnia magna TaxID=35525 RepID=A0A164GHA8_9CRUS|nr:Uncharacterized protein APZ42_005384 [Daphnia magna]